MTKYRSRQEIFDIALLGLIAQGSPAKAPEDEKDYSPWACLYRGADGTKCGIGFLIADEDYIERMEHQSITTCYSIGDAARISLPDRDYGQDVQNIHDQTVTYLRNDDSVTFYDALLLRVEEFSERYPDIDTSKVRAALAEAEANA